jgi:hypothetical protein
MRRIFGPKRNEVLREWRKIHNDELNELHSSPKFYSGNEIENNEMGEAYNAYGGDER